MISRPLIIFLCRANTTTATTATTSSTTHISRATARAATLTLAGFDAHVIVDADNLTPNTNTLPQTCVARVHFPRASELTRLGWTDLSNPNDGRRWERATLWAHDILRSRDGVPASESLSSTNNVWFIDADEKREDENVHTHDTNLQGLVTAYMTDPADLIVSPPQSTTTLSPQYWRSANGVIPPAFLSSCSTAPFMRLSYRTLAACAALARARGRLLSRDILFPSIIRMLSAGVFNVRQLSLPTPLQPSIISSSSAAAANPPTATATLPPTLTHHPVRTIWLNSPWTDAELSTPPPPPLSTPRVAVAFFGLVKDFALVSASVERHLLSPLRRAGFEKIDLFCHTNALDAVTNPRNNEKGARVFPASLSSSLPLKGLSFSDPTDIDTALPVSHFLRNGDAWPESSGLSALFYVRQLVSLDQVTRLWTAHAAATDTTYDAIIYTRPDILFFNDVDIARHLPLRPNTLYAPNFHTWVPNGTGSHGVGINDRFAFGCSDVMKVYGSRLSYVDSFLARVDRPMLHSEAFLAALSALHRWSVIDLAVRFGRVRAGGTLVDSPFDAKLRFGPNTPAVTTTLAESGGSGSGGGDITSTDASISLAAAARAIGCSDVPVRIERMALSDGRKRARSIAIDFS